MNKRNIGEPIDVPRRYPTSTIYVDESGAKASASAFFVVAAAKVRKQGALPRAIQDVRDKTGFRHEFKFSEITRGSLPAWYLLIDAIENSDLHVAATVVDRTVYNPFGAKPLWVVQAEVTTQLLAGCINKRELVGVMIDGISTPAGVCMDDVIRNRVNSRFGATSIVSAACLDSRTNDMLQVADLIAGAVAFERRRIDGESGKPNSNKGKVVARLRTALGVESFADGRSDRVNIATLQPRTRTKQPALTVVTSAPAV